MLTRNVGFQGSLFDAHGQSTAYATSCSLHSDRAHLHIRGSDDEFGLAKVLAIESDARS